MENYETDCKTGRALAQAMIDRIKRDNAPCKLNFEAQEIAAQGGGIAVGYFQGIAEALIRTENRSV